MSRPTAQRPASWLAQEQTTFVGRAAELARLRAMLATSRLATVAGPGGVGKTRLALRAAAIAGPSFADGVRFAPLSGLRDPELLPHTIAAALDLPEHDPRPRLEQVLDHLRDRHLLLILDTCEHLIEACALFAEAVLERTERVTILATSREPLGVAGEHEYQLAPLAEGLDGDAVELFAKRAAEAAPGFAGSGASRAEMARLCRLLDGIPLAIELAAVQLREVSFEELGRRIESRHLDLARVRPDPAVTARHQTLRDAIGWSHELCAPGERLLWERLSVFAGPVTAEAAAEVCAGPDLDRDAVLNALVGLVGKSVLTRSGGDVSRYGLLDTIREYGAERLAASGSRSRVRGRHLRRYLGLAGELADRPLRDQVARHRTLSTEHNDIRAALEFAGTVPASPGRAHPAAELPAKLAWYWVISGRNAEAAYWLTRGLEHVPEPGPARAAALITRGYMVAYMTDLDGGFADAGAGIAMADDLGDRWLGARGRIYRAYMLLTANRPGEARAAAAEAEAKLGRDVREADADLPVLLGVVRAYLELLAQDPRRCLAACERALRLIPAGSGERWGSGYLYTMAGLSLWLLGQAGEGNRACLRGMAMKQEIGDIAGLAHCLGNAALIAGAQKRHERAAWLLGASSALWDRFGSVYIGVDIMQVLTDQARADARHALGGDRYAELVSDGESRPLDEVVEVAVRDADRLPALLASR